MSKIFVEMTEAEYSLFTGLRDRDEKVIFSYLYNWLDMRSKIKKSESYPSPYLGNRIAAVNGADVVKIVDKNDGTTKTLKIELTVIAEE